MGQDSVPLPRRAPLLHPGAWENTELDEWEKTRIHKNSKMFIFLEKKVCVCGGRDLK